MPANFPGPGELRIFYTVTVSGQVFAHVHRLSFFPAGTSWVPGSAFGDLSVTRKDGSPTSLIVWTTTYLTHIRNQLHTSVDITHMEAWLYEPNSFDSQFISAEPLGVNGANASPAQPASQTIVTLRTDQGGITKLDLRTTSRAPGPAQGFPTSVAAINDWANYVAQPFNPSNRVVIGRDNGYAFVPVRYLPGQNEKAWRRLNR
jgi:hypothetical protein